MENSHIKPWSKILNRIGFGIGGISLLLFAISLYAPQVYPEFVKAGAAGSLLLATFLFTLSSFLHKGPPLENTKFWLRRAALDSVIAFLVFPLFFVAILSFLTGKNVFEEVMNGQSESINIGDGGLSPLAFFILAFATQLSLGAIILFRALFKTLPALELRMTLKNFKQDIGIVVLYALMILAASFAYGIVIQLLGIQIPPQYTFEEEAKSASWLILISGAILAPIFEELFFRGYLLKIMVIKNKPWLGVLLSSFVFAIIHFQFMHFIPLFVIGVVLGFSYVKSKNILVPIAIHGVNNLLVLLLMIFVQQQ